MKINIEGYIETENEIEVDYFINDGELQTTIISRDELWRAVKENDLNIWSEDKWDYAREEHYTVDHVTDIDEYIEENMNDLLTAAIFSSQKLEA